MDSDNILCSKRNYGFDFLKYLCAFMVIMIHLKYPYKSYIEPFTRIAVPIFFMITGYYYTNIKNHYREKAQICKIFKILSFSVTVYFIKQLFDNILVKNLNLKETFSKLGFFTEKHWIKLIFFNDTSLALHLWYLFALIYVLVIVYLFEKKWSISKLYPLIIPLLICNLLLGNYSIIVFGLKLPLNMSRNFLFVGLPHFLLGDMFYRCKKQIHFSNKFLLTSLVTSAITTFIETIFLLNLDKKINWDYFISTPILTCSIFLLVCQNQEFFSKNILSKIAYLGKNYSLFVYIFHPLMIYIFDKILPKQQITESFLQFLYSLFYPLIILIITTILAFVVKTVFKKIVINHKN